MTYENGSTWTYDVPNVSALQPAATTKATDLEPLGDGLRSERFALGPGDDVGMTFDDVPDDPRLVYAVPRSRENATPRGRGMARRAATDARMELCLAIDPNGSLAVSTHCATEGTPSGG